MFDAFVRAGLKGADAAADAAAAACASRLVASASALAREYGLSIMSSFTDAGRFSASATCCGADDPKIGTNALLLLLLPFAWPPDMVAGCAAAPVPAPAAPPPPPKCVVTGWNPARYDPHLFPAFKPPLPLGAVVAAAAPWGARNAAA